MGWQDTKGNWSQRQQRTETDFTDQHGRRYHATIEIKTGDPCGLIEPLFTAPLMPPQQFLQRVPRMPYSLNINYAAWKAEIKTAWDDWQREGRNHARKLHGDAYDPTKPFTGEVLSIIGPAPTAIDPVVAAEQGNKWVLGLTNRIDTRLYRFFEPTQVDPDYRDPAEPDYSQDEDDLLFDDAEPTAQVARRVPQVAKTDRNQAMLIDHEDGMPYAKIAAKYSVSDPRARQIVKKQTERNATKAEKVA